MDLTSTGNTKLLEKTITENARTARLLKPSSYKKQSNTFCWKDNHEKALLDMTFLMEQQHQPWEYASSFDLAVETYLYYKYLYRSFLKLWVRKISQNLLQSAF